MGGWGYPVTVGLPCMIASGMLVWVFFEPAYRGVWFICMARRLAKDQGYSFRDLLDFIRICQDIR